MQDQRREVIESLGPARPLPNEKLGDKLEEGIGLCLSGGGYRAMLFHVGAIWRLNETGYLSKLTRISSVSGGSICAGQLAIAWPELEFQNGVATKLVDKFVKPLRGLADHTIDRGGILKGIFTPGTIGEKLAGAYKQHLFGDRTLQDLPDDPRFVINATNLQSAVLWRFEKPYMRDYRVGEVKSPTIALATAVAASAAFPPFLSPVRLKLKDSDYTPGSGDDLQMAPYTTDVVLADGGVYDNLGLETIWKRYKTILVSDGGGHIAAKPKPPADWGRQFPRILSVIDSQVRSLRKRQVQGLFELGHRDGAYWGIRSHIADFPAPDPLPCDPVLTTRLADTPTRLGQMPPALQERLINWGYAVTDAALRAHVDKSLPKPGGFPYPASGVG